MTEALPSEADYREHVRTWLESNATPRGEEDLWRVKMHSSEVEAAESFQTGTDWQKKLYAAGFAGIPYPVEYGGQGGASWQTRIFAEESANYEEDAGFIRATIAMLAPTLLRHGSEEQKREFLPKLFSAEMAFCQLFSEPGAGSDLATLATSAIRDGDEFVLNGQKVWNSAAQFCDWGFILARTDPDVVKHAGISFFLVNMSSPGVEVRPLVQMSGARHFNEVFLNDVRIPAAQLVGELHQGWAAARTVLSNESAFIGGGQGISDAEKLRALAEDRGRTGDPVVRQRLADLYARELIQKGMSSAIKDAVRRGDAPPIDGSLIKLYVTESRRRVGELAMDLVGAHGLTATTPADLWAQQELYLRFSLSIGGGTNEVQRNNLAERALGLPKEMRSDKNLPWKEIPRS